MATLVWDEVGARRYETGIDRGVLFLEDSAVPWNGLVSVAEAVSREVKSYYIDGVKYLDRHVPGSYEATLSAFTYPDEFEDLLGNEEFAPGVVVHDQRPKMFDLSYRTGIGNDLEGMDHGYRLHIIYNVLAVPNDVTMTTVGQQVSAQTFGFKLFGTPAHMFGIRPTSHISLNSTRIDSGLLEEVEELLYGTVSVDPALPDLIELLGMLE